MDIEFLDLEEKNGKCCCGGYCISEKPNRMYEDQKMRQEEHKLKHSAYKDYFHKIKAGKNKRGKQGSTGNL